VVVNPGASRGDVETVREALDRHGEDGSVSWRIVDSGSADDPLENLEREIRAARSEGFRRVVAAGGDGTVSLVANAMLKAGVRKAMDLAILPLGSANVLAQELSIPASLDAAVATALGGSNTASLDAVRFGDTRLFTQVGVGLDAAIIRGTDEESRARFGALAYAGTLVAKAQEHPARLFEIEIDGRTVKARASEVVLANAATLAVLPFTWGPDIHVGDGVLNLCIFNTQSLTEYLTDAFRALTGQHPGAGNGRIRHLKVRRKVVIRRPARMPVQGDGEIIGRTPIELRVSRSVLRFVIPDAAADDTQETDSARTDTARRHATR
jgi:diacylglycerol kinase family enzyme